MLQDLVGCLLCFLSESEAFFVIDGLIKAELDRIETAEESCPVVLLSTASESLIAGFVIESLRQDMKEVSHSISQATLDIDGKPSWDSALPYLWGMLQGWLRNIWVGHAPLDLAFRSVDLILMRAFDQLGLLKLAVLEHLSAVLQSSIATSPSSGEPNGTGVMPMLKALNHISPAEIHSVAQRGLFELKINPTKALARVIKHKVNPPVPPSPIAPLSSRSGPKFLGDCTMHYLPNPLPSSSIVQDGHFEFIWKHLDERFKATEDVRRIFNSREHGLSLTALFDHSKDAGNAPSIVFIETMKHSVFGAVIMSPIHDSDFRIYDFQSSFVFSLFPHEEVWRRIPESGAIDYHQHCTHDRLCIGIGSHGTAIALFDGLDKGVSEPTDIFNNPCLHGDSDSGDFEVLAVEMYMFKTAWD